MQEYLVVALLLTTLLYLFPINLLSVIGSMASLFWDFLVNPECWPVFVALIFVTYAFYHSAIAPGFKSLCRRLKAIKDAFNSITDLPEPLDLQLIGATAPGVIEQAIEDPLPLEGSPWDEAKFQAKAEQFRASGTYPKTDRSEFSRPGSDIIDVQVPSPYLRWSPHAPSWRSTWTGTATEYKGSLFQIPKSQQLQSQEPTNGRTAERRDSKGKGRADPEKTGKLSKGPEASLVHDNKYNSQAAKKSEESHQLATTQQQGGAKTFAIPNVIPPSNTAQAPAQTLPAPSVSHNGADQSAVILPPVAAVPPPTTAIIPPPSQAVIPPTVAAVAPATSQIIYTALNLVPNPVPAPAFQSAAPTAAVAQTNNIQQDDAMDWVPSDDEMDMSEDENLPVGHLKSPDDMDIDDASYRSSFAQSQQPIVPSAVVFTIAAPAASSFSSFANPAPTPQSSAGSSAGSLPPSTIFGMFGGGDGSGRLSGGAGSSTGGSSGKSGKSSAKGKKPKPSSDDDDAIPDEFTQNAKKIMGQT